MSRIVDCTECRKEIDSERIGKVKADRFSKPDNQDRNPWAKLVRSR